MIDFFIDAYREASWFSIILELVAFIFGILSVWFARNENIWVYPTGLICTVITVYLLYQAHYFGDMMMNIYYSIMSIYGWILWGMKKNHQPLLHISYTNIQEKWQGLFLCLLTMIITYFVYITYPFWGNFFTEKSVHYNELQSLIATYFWNPPLEPLQYVDILTSGIFFTAMWYMAKKKIENWTLWIIGDAITVPLYAARGLGILSLQYFIFLILAVSGYIAWKNSIKKP